MSTTTTNNNNEKLHKILNFPGNELNPKSVLRWLELYNPKFDRGEIVFRNNFFNVHFFPENQTYKLQTNYSNIDITPEFIKMLNELNKIVNE
jgi:hypothetical protein